MNHKKKPFKSAIKLIRFFHPFKKDFYYWIGGLVVVLFIAGVWVLKTTDSTSQITHSTWWKFQSIDTMKESRDKAREKLNSESYVNEIENQVAKIAQTGATHVAIATPYDEEFLPFLKRWVAAARKNNLKVWFRGNWSNWEGWFGYEKKMTFDTHIQKSIDFIKDNPQLFEDGDYFTGCPECENGVQGDPRQTGKVDQYRQFLITETSQTKKAFEAIGKKVETNLLSMNKDVAELVMDKDTSKAVGGIITIDHYVKDPKKLNDDITALAEKTNSRIVLGEWGAPINDIHGSMDEQAQSEWIEQSLNYLSENKYLVGLSYWTNLNGSTAIWGQNFREKEAVNSIRHFYKPKQAYGEIRDQLGFKVSDVQIKIPHRTFISSRGEYLIPVFSNDSLEFSKKGYKTQTFQLQNTENELQKNVILERDNPPFWYRLLLYVTGKKQS